jgi:hypothetical protein
MKKRLLLHAGVHRTGTTAVQRTFRSNAHKLAQQGILYPVHYTPSESEAWNHQRLAWDVHSGRLDRTELATWIGRLVAAPEHTVVLSAEDFCILKDLSFLEPFREAFDVRAVFYLRRQDSWVTSWYSQHKKWPFDAALAEATPAEFLTHLDEFYWLRYFDTLERWAAVLGRGAIHVRVFESGEVRDPVADMCELCGMRALLEIEVGRLNESLPADHIEILRRLRLGEYSDDIRWLIIRALAKVPGTTSGEIYPSSVRSLILDRYSMQNQKVAEHYLRRPDKVLFRDLAMADSPASMEQRVDMEQMLAFVRSLLSEIAAAQPWQAPQARQSHTHKSSPGARQQVNGGGHATAPPASTRSVSKP